MIRALLRGGPEDGKVMTVDPSLRFIYSAYAPPIKLPPLPPRKPPWYRVRARRRWRQAENEYLQKTLQPMSFNQIIYTRASDHENGCTIFRLASPWKHWQSTEIFGGDGPADSPREMLDVLAQADPYILQQPRTCWVMSPPWFDRLRSSLTREVFEPADGDMLFGVPVTVTQGGGRPHLENPVLAAEGV